MMLNEYARWAIVHSVKDQNLQSFQNIVWGDKALIAIENAEKLCILVDIKNYVRTTFDDLNELSEEDFIWVINHYAALYSASIESADDSDALSIPLSSVLVFNSELVRMILLSKPYDFSCLYTNAGLSDDDVNQLSADRVYDLVNHIYVFQCFSDLGGEGAEMAKLLRLNNAGLAILLSHIEELSNLEEANECLDMLLTGSPARKREAHSPLIFPHAKRPKMEGDEDEQNKENRPKQLKI